MKNADAPNCILLPTNTSENAIISAMENKREIPYWVEIVRECLFVDNTAYIHELEPCKTTR